MKTRITVLMMFAVLMCSTAISNATERVGWFRKTFCSLTWDEIQTVANTPKRICAAVRTHVRYSEDQCDNWSSGKETWDKKQGDCKGYAACVTDLCKAAGIKTETKVFFPKGSMEGHAVVVGSSNGQLWISSNGWYQNIKSMDEAKKVVAKAIGWRHKEIMVTSLEEAKSGSLNLAIAAH